MINKVFYRIIPLLVVIAILATLKSMYDEKERVKNIKGKASKSVEMKKEKYNSK